MPSGSHPGGYRGQVEGIDPVLAAGPGTPFWGTAAENPCHQRTHVDTATSGTRGTRYCPPQGLPGRTAEGGILVDSLRTDLAPYHRPYVRVGQETHGETARKGSLQRRGLTNDDDERLP